ncbi:MAG: protein of unknown function YccS/YhfK [Herminiimonas sp.]|nr:protein of unknown function YccS/YhfK [Herminiimonas sp.]
MHYALNPRTFLFSHYFYTGLRIAVGVIGLTFLALLYSDLPTAMTVSIGALCTSLMDLPSPIRHKFNEMLASVLLCSAVTLIVSLCAPVHWLLDIMVVLVSFFASMMVVYGRKSMPLQFAALFAMTLSMANTLTVRQAFLHSGLFLAGGSGYLAYAMAVAWFIRYRTKQQVLAEALYELARYIDIKADFYDIRTNLDTQFGKLVRQQIVLAEKQQASRDLILRGLQRTRDAVLVQVHYGMLDLYELVLSTHTDYELLRRHFTDADVLIHLRDIVSKAALDIESIAYAVTRKRESFVGIDYQAEVQAIDQELFRLESDNASGGVPNEALTILRASYVKIRALIDMIGQLHLATQAPAGPLPIIPERDMTPFLTQQKYELRMLLANLRMTSPIFRFALRVTMAISAGLLAAEYLPYAAHGYWIVLTIVVILKPSFSMTKQRRSDRLIGTLIGCVLTALILRFVHAPAALLGFLFLATVAAPAFVYIKYRYTAIAASMQILLQIGLMIPGSTHAISERLIDTLIGAAIATLFSYVLPSWEYRALPRLIRSVLNASQRYIDASRELLQRKSSDDFVYRLCRKRFMDSLAGLSAALVRMLDEPPSKHRAAEDINQFIVQNYLVVAHVAAIRFLLRRHTEGLPQESVNAVLQQVSGTVWNKLAQAQQALDALTPAGDMQRKKADPSIPVPVTEETTAWPGWLPLQRRTKLLYADAEQIAFRSLIIGRLLAQSD